MISTPDRQQAVMLIDEAVAGGARRYRACETLGIDDRTYRRWTAEGAVRADSRPNAARPTPVHALTDAERAQVLAICHQGENASLPPSQIVPKLADEGVYVASESSFYRILHAHQEQHHRGRAQPPRPRRTSPTHSASAPCQLWTWDISFLRSAIRGRFFYLYMILDVYSRKIVGWEVHHSESGDYAAELVGKAVLAEGGIGRPLVLHADNGSIQRGSTLRTKLEQLGIEPSYSRPRVSDDNPYSESLFRTCKYRPDFPTDGFDDIKAAREWVARFVYWYNEVHCHSGIRFVTPGQRHRGEDSAMLTKRHEVYAGAKARNPSRWSGETRNWQPATTVWLNPERDTANSVGKELETI